MKKIRRIVTVLLTLFVSFALVPVVFAHPLGNFTINQYVGLKVSREIVLMDYVVDMAEIPAFQEINALDANGNGQPDSSEFNGYSADKCTSLQPNLTLLLNTKSATFTLASASVEFPAGVGGLPTLRLTCEFSAPIDLAQSNPKLSFTNSTYPDRIGWKEIVVNGDGVSLQGDFATTSLSNRLTSYPQDLLASPLDQRSVDFEITSIAVSPQTEVVVPASQNAPLLKDRNDAFTRLILMDEITWPALLIALTIAFVWGAMHAMTPGHGKTIVGAYLVGSRGTAKHAVYLGLTTTITHTLGVFAFGLITLFAAQYIVPEKLFPWITVLSGLFVVGIGMNLFVERLRSSGIGSWFSRLKINSKSLQPAYSPSLHGLRVETSEHKHGYVLIPHHGHAHDYNHHHSHYFHDVDGHHHEHLHEGHSHDHAEHSHTPPEAITWRSLLALGVSGGLLPCPSALVVLLGAIALNRIGFGLILVLAFSLGLAGALTAIGLAFIYAGKLFERFPSRGRIISILPAFSALFISLIGLGIVYRVLAELGIV